MPASPQGQAAGLRRWLDTLTDAGGTDAELLQRLLVGDPAAAEAVVRRHGPMVLGVCRRLLGGGPDADDAFQATFLVLVKRAHAVRPGGGLGNWLYGVARRTALKARATSRRWNARVPLDREPPAPPAPEGLAELEEELAALPDHYRAALVLCELEGLTVKEAARQLDVPQGTVASRLSRGRALLAERLRGKGAPAPASALPAPSLLAATVSAVCQFAAGAPLAAAASASVASLTQQVLQSMLPNKLKFLCAALFALGLLAVTALALVPAATTPPDAPGAKKEASRKEAPKPAPAKKDAGQALLENLDRAFCRSLAALVKEERDAGKLVTSRELVRGAAKAFPKEESLTRLAKELDKEKKGKEEASEAVLDLLAEYFLRYGQGPTSADAFLTREQRQAFSERQAALGRLAARYKGRDAVKWVGAQKADGLAALRRINAYRKRAGLKALPLDGDSDILARRHAMYLDLNREGDRFHDDQPVEAEVPGRPGYTHNGQLLAASTLAGFGKAADVVDGWMATLPGRCALLRPDLSDVRIGQALSVPAGKGIRGPLVVARYSNVKGVAPGEKAVVAWPEDGATGVPLRMLDQRPSFVPAGARRDRQGCAEVGYPVSVTFWGAGRIARVKASLRRLVGGRWEEVPAYLSTPDSPALPETWTCNLGSACLIARAPLVAGASYRAEFKAEVDGKPFEKTISFRTGKEGPPIGPAFKYGPPTTNSLNNAFRYQAGLLLGSERSFAVVGDEKYLAALDGAFYRLVLWRARWERLEGDAGPWRPLMELAKDWAPGRKELAALLTKVAAAARPLPADGLEMVADHAVRYRDLAKMAGAPRAVRDKAQKRLDTLLAFYRKHGGKGLEEVEARTKRMAEEGVAALNGYRRRLKLPEVELDARVSRACRNHAVYIDLNRGEGPASWAFWGMPTPHEAKRGLPGYSEAGAFAGMSSDIAFGTPRHCVNGWMSSFFHRIPLLNPDAKKVGVGTTLSADAFAKGTGRVALLSVPAITRRGVKKAEVLYPEPGAKGVLRNYGLESPNPIASPEKKNAKGWPVAGFPVTATFFGREKITKVAGKLLVKKAGKWEEVPAYFSSPEKPAAYFSDNMKTACLMAKDWLAPNTAYRAEFSAELDGWAWRGETTFTTGGEKALVGEE